MANFKELEIKSKSNNGSKETIKINLDQVSELVYGTNEITLIMASGISYPIDKIQAREITNPQDDNSKSE